MGQMPHHSMVLKDALETFEAVTRVRIFKLANKEIIELINRSIYLLFLYMVYFRTNLRFLYTFLSTTGLEESRKQVILYEICFNLM